MYMTCIWHVWHIWPANPCRLPGHCAMPIPWEPTRRHLLPCPPAPPRHLVLEKQEEKLEENMGNFGKPYVYLLYLMVKTMGSSSCIFSLKPIHWVAASHQDWGYLWNFGYGVELETPYPPYEMVLYVMFCIVSCECQLHVFQQKRHPHSNWSRPSYTEYASQPVILIYVGWTGGNLLL